MSKYMCNGILNPVAPFDFNKSLQFLGVFNPMKDEQSLLEHSLIKAVKIKGTTYVFKIKSVGTIENPKLVYELHSDYPISEDNKEIVIERINFFLSLSDDLSSFYKLAKKDATFVPVFKQLYGYHQVKFLTPFENACWAIISQRMPMSIARRIKQQLSYQYGGKLVVGDHEYIAFPEPYQINSLDK